MACPPGSAVGKALARIGPLPLRRNGGGFPALLDIIMGQQVSVASADAIWKRLEAAGLTVAGRVAEASETTCAAAVFHVRKFAMLMRWRERGSTLPVLTIWPTIR